MFRNVHRPIGTAFSIKQYIYIRNLEHNYDMREERKWNQRKDTDDENQMERMNVQILSFLGQGNCNNLKLQVSRLLFCFVSTFLHPSTNLYQFQRLNCHYRYYFCYTVQSISYGFYFCFKFFSFYFSLIIFFFFLLVFFVICKSLCL